MSDFEYTHMKRRFSVDTAASGGSVYVTAQPTSAPLYGMYIPSPDVPTVAAELLKAAGYDYLAGYIEADIDGRERAETEAAEKKLQERRDAVLKEMGIHDSYESLGPKAPMRKAVDRILELATLLKEGTSRD